MWCNVTTMSNDMCVRFLWVSLLKMPLYEQLHGNSSSFLVNSNTSFFNMSIVYIIYLLQCNMSITMEPCSLWYCNYTYWFSMYQTQCIILNFVSFYIIFQFWQKHLLCYFTKLFYHVVQCSQPSYVNLRVCVYRCQMS